MKRWPLDGFFFELRWQRRKILVSMDRLILNFTSSFCHKLWKVRTNNLLGPRLCVLNNSWLWRSKSTSWFTPKHVNTPHSPGRSNFRTILQIRWSTCSLLVPFLNHNWLLAVEHTRFISSTTNSNNRASVIGLFELKFVGYFPFLIIVVMIPPKKTNQVLGHVKKSFNTIGLTYQGTSYCHSQDASHRYYHLLLMFFFFLLYSRHHRRWILRQSNIDFLLAWRAFVEFISENMFTLSIGYAKIRGLVLTSLLIWRACVVMIGSLIASIILYKSGRGLI